MCPIKFCIPPALLIASLSAMGQDAPLSGEEIRAAWVGKTVIGQSAAGQAISLRLESDGKASVTAGTLQDVGVWRVVDRGYCATWKVIRNGQERCFTVKRVGAKWIVSNPDGSLNSSVDSAK